MTSGLNDDGTLKAALVLQKRTAKSIAAAAAAKPEVKRCSYRNDGRGKSMSKSLHGPGTNTDLELSYFFGVCK